MIERPLWSQRIKQAWRHSPIVWLTGVRRVGKTVLAKAISDAEYLNCDLPFTRARLADPESFFRSVRRGLVIFDEIHRLSEPAETLKIGADEFPQLRILATGSSTLAATQKFRDSLTGRKTVVKLTPVLGEELTSFDRSIEERLLRGGLPPALLQEADLPEFYAEWMDSYFARDVQELFRLGKRTEFLNLMELAFRQSAGMLEVTSLAKHAGVSRPTIMSWLEVMEVTHAIHLVRPFAGGGRREILAQPKLYAFDTGFICFVRGWSMLRTEDCGLLWEHLVLDALRFTISGKIHFWRTKSGREVDFVIPRGRDSIDTIECRWNPSTYDISNLLVFREEYPNGRNFIVAPHLVTGYRQALRGLNLEFVNLQELRLALKNR